MQWMPSTDALTTASPFGSLARIVARSLANSTLRNPTGAKLKAASEPV
jgi:hypothetical protein